MRSEAIYNSVSVHDAGELSDPYRRASFSVRNRIARQLWNLAWLVLYRPSPRLLFGWRNLLLRIFGARLGRDCRFYPSSRIWAPWNLLCADVVTVAEGTEIYNQGPIRIGSHVILSQGAYLCASTHDYNDAEFPLLAYPMEIGAYAWICARAVVGPRVCVGKGAVLGLGSVASRDLEDWGVYAGSPAVKVKERNCVLLPSATKSEAVNTVNEAVGAEQSLVAE